MDVDTTITYYAVGDNVTRQTTENIMPYSAFGVTTEEEAKALIDPIAEEFQGIAGVEHSFEYRENEVVETLAIDYSKANVEEVSKLPGSEFSGNTKSGKVSLEGSVKVFEEQGFTKVEN